MRRCVIVLTTLLFLGSILTPRPGQAIGPGACMSGCQISYNMCFVDHYGSLGGEAGAALFCQQGLTGCNVGCAVAWYIVLSHFSTMGAAFGGGGIGDREDIQVLRGLHKATRLQEKGMAKAVKLYAKAQEQHLKALEVAQLTGASQSLIDEINSWIQNGQLLHDTLSNVLGWDCHAAAVLGLIPQAPDLPGSLQLSESAGSIGTTIPPEAAQFPKLEKILAKASKLYARGDQAYNKKLLGVGVQFTKLEKRLAGFVAKGLVDQSLADQVVLTMQQTYDDLLHGRNVRACFE